MKYTVNICVNNPKNTLKKASGAIIVGLKESPDLHARLLELDIYPPGTPPQDLTLHFCHLALEFDEQPPHSPNKHDKFYGGEGEGRSFNNWQDAILCSLYDHYQVNDNLHEGDEFECTYRGKVSAKNKGEIDMYFVEKEKVPEAAV